MKAISEKKDNNVVTIEQVDTMSIKRADDARLAELGYKSEFRREFTVSKQASTMCYIGSNQILSMSENRDRLLCVLDHGSCCERVVDVVIWVGEWCVAGRNLLRETLS